MVGLSTHQKNGPRHMVHPSRCLRPMRVLFIPRNCAFLSALGAALSGISLVQIWRLVFPVPFGVYSGGSSRDSRLLRGSDCQ